MKAKDLRVGDSVWAHIFDIPCTFSIGKYPWQLTRVRASEWMKDGLIISIHRDGKQIWPKEEQK